MNGSARESGVTSAFIELADTLVSDYDVVEVLHSLVQHCVDLLDADAAGLLLSDQRGSLQVLASSTERTRLLELFQLEAGEGPCLDCFRSGQAVVVADLTHEVDRWPKFAPAALGEGYLSLYAVPMRLRDEVIGALNLFRRTAGDLGEGDQQLTQGLADVATIGILQERAIHHGEVLVEQLQGALDSRIIIEQAKGILAERSGVDMDQAFARLRAHARSTGTGLAAAALALVDGDLDQDAVLAAAIPLRLA